MGRRLAKSDIDFHRPHYRPLVAGFVVVACLAYWPVLRSRKTKPRHL